MKRLVTALLATTLLSPAAVADATPSEIRDLLDNPAFWDWFRSDYRAEQR